MFNFSFILTKISILYGTIPILFLQNFSSIFSYSHSTDTISLRTWSTAPWSAHEGSATPIIIPSFNVIATLFYAFLHFIYGAQNSLPCLSRYWQFPSSVCVPQPYFCFYFSQHCNFLTLLHSFCQTTIIQVSQSLCSDFLTDVSMHAIQVLPIYHSGQWQNGHTSCRFCYIVFHVLCIRLICLRNRLLLANYPSPI